jgi:hypothetical protein
LSKNAKDGTQWVSARAVAWVIHDAPVPADLAFTLTVIAARCDEHGRGSYASTATIAERVGKSPKQTQRDIVRLRELKLLLLGDQSLANHLPPGQRPVVYDVPLNVHGSKPVKESRNKSAGRKAHDSPGSDANTTPMDGTPPADGTPPVGEEGTPPIHGRSTPPMDVQGPLPSMGAKQPMNNPFNNPSLSAAARTIADATDATAEEARETAELIKRERNPDNLAAYITTCARNGSLPDWLNRVRTGDTTPRTNGKFAPGTGALAPLPTDDEYATGKVIL